MVARDAIPMVLTAADLAELLGKRVDVRLLDVRTPGDFEGWAEQGRAVEKDSAAAQAS